MATNTVEYAYQAIGDILVEEGVENLFTLMSDGTIGLVTYLADEYDNELEMIHTRHESGAVSMADGYARATGDIGVCAVGRGPGLSNTATSLLTARKKGSNVLVITPKRPLSREYDNPAKRFDQNALLQTTVGGSDSDRNRFGNSDRVVDITSYDTLYADFAEVFRRLRAGEGPIAVQIPNDLLNESGTIERPLAGTSSDESDPDSGGVLTPKPEQVTAAIDLFRESDVERPPVIIAGEGAVKADAKDEILTFAERTNAMLTTTVQSRGFFHGHPYALGMAGGFGTELAKEYLTESDYILAIGCSLNQFTTDRGRLLGEGADRSNVVHVDVDPKSFGRYTPIDVPIHGDAKATLKALNRELAAASIDRGEISWNNRTKQRIADANRPARAADFETDGPHVDPRGVMAFLNDVIPEDRIVLHDTGHHQFWVLDGIDVYEPGNFIWTKDFAAVGEALKIGIGAAVDESRTCVTFCGDGGFMMSLQELETAVRHDLPIVVVVLNNRALGAEYNRVVRAQLPTEGSQIETPDIGGVAESFGADGYTITDLEDLETLAEKLAKRPDGPIVLNCEISRDTTSSRSPSG